MKYMAYNCVFDQFTSQIVGVSIVVAPGVERREILKFLKFLSLPWFKLWIDTSYRQQRLNGDCSEPSALRPRPTSWRFVDVALDGITMLPGWRTDTNLVDLASSLHAWWHAILAQIRNNDVVVLALSPD